MVYPFPDTAQSTLLTPTEGATAPQESSFRNVTSGAGGSGGGGGSSAAARRAAAEKAAIEAAKKAAAKKAEIEKQIATAKSQAEKTRLARAFVEMNKAEAERKRIIQERTNLIRRGATEQRVISTDVKTGDKLQVSQWRDRSGNRVERIVNLNTGETKYSSFKKPSRGSVVQTGSVSLGGGSLSKAEWDNVAKNLRNNGLVPIRVSSRDGAGAVTSFKSNLTGKTYAYTNSGIAAFNKDSESGGAVFKKYVEDYKNQYGMSKITGNFEEASSWFLNKKVQNRIQIEKLESEMKKLKLEGKKMEALKLAQERQKLKNELVGYTVGQRFTQLLGGAKEIPTIAKTIYNDKSAIIPISLAIWEGTKADWVDTWQLVKTAPGQAVAKIGTDYFTFAIVGKVLRLTGKVTRPIAIKLNPKWVKIGSGRIKIKVPKKAFTYLVKSTIIKRTSKTLKSFKSISKKSDIGKSIAKVERRIGNVQRKISSKKSKIIKQIATAKTNVRLRKELKQTMQRAKKIRKLARKKGETVYIRGPDYKRAITILEDLSDAIATARAVKFIENYIKNGGEITVKQSNLLMNAVRDKMRNNLYQLDDFRTLKSLEKYSGAEAIKLIKIGKIKSAKIYLQKIIRKIESLKIVKEISLYLKKIKGGINKPVKIISKFKGRTIKQISTAKTNVRLRKARKLTLKRAKKIRKLARKKGETVVFGSNDFSKAVLFLEDFSDNLAVVKIKKFLSDIEKGGVKLSQVNQEKLLDAAKIFLRKELAKSTDFINLKKVATMNKPFSIRMIKQGKIKSAKIIANKLSAKIKKAPVVRYIKSLTNRIKKIPTTIRKGIKTKRLQAMSRKIRMKTNRYKMEKARPIRQVTLEQFSKSSDISKMNKFIDFFFDNMGRKQKLDISVVKFKQMKNLLKKRMARAIKRNDTVEISNFRKEIAKLISDMNKKSSNPDVVVVEKVGKTKRFRTIKDFETETPKGTFVEVKVGNQVLLQKVETKLKSKMATQKMQPQQLSRQKMEIVSVKKKSIKLKPLIMFGIKSLSASAVRNMMESKQGFSKLSNQTQLFKTLQDSAQDLKILQAVAQDVMSASAVAQAVAQDVNSRLKTSPKQKTKTILRREKKPTPRLKLPIKFSQKKVSKKTPTYYVVEKVRGKFKRLYPGALSISDAKDYAVYSIDNRLSKSAFFVPSGLSKNIAVAPKNIQGYYSRNSKKFRPYKIRMGKKKDLVNGFIEKRKYFQDTSGERVQAARLRAKAPKRKITPAQRRELLKRLAKARAVRMKNLRKRK